MWAQIAVAAIGIWFMAAPAVLSYGGSADRIARIAGPIITTFAIVAASECTRGLRWANLPAGLLLMTAPVFVDHSQPALVNSIACGAAVAALAFIRGRMTARYGGGWRAIWRRSIYDRTA